MAGENEQRAKAATARILRFTGVQAAVYMQVAQEAGEDVRNAIVRELSKSRSPSMPGQPPGVVTGILRNSIFMNVHKTKTRVQIEVGTRVKYATHLEYGTRNMAPRPFMRTTIARITPAINRKVQARIRAIMP